MPSVVSRKDKNGTSCRLAIDHGSTSLRGILMPDLFDYAGNLLDEPIEQHLQPNSQTIQSFRYMQGDFSNTIYPFDSYEPRYLGNDIDPTRRGISAKYAFYALVDKPAIVGAGKECFEEYMMVKDLLREAEARSKVFRARLREGLLELFHTIASAALATARRKGWQITSIVASVPAHWNDSFETEYAALLNQVFDYRFDAADIIFLTEVESLAHFLLRRHLDQVIPTKSLDCGFDVIALFDFGGHSMSGCVYCVRHGVGDRDAAFYAMSDDFSAGGGSELWEYYIEQQILEELGPSRRISDAQRQECIEAFHRKKRTIKSEDTILPLKIDSTSLDSEKPKGSVDWKITLTPKHIIDCFERGFKKCLEVAKEQLKDLAVRMKGFRSPVIVVAGGSADSRLLRSRFIAMCDSEGLPRPIFTSDLQDVQYSTGKIATGAALATSNYMTAEHLIRRGAAFALQLGTPEKRTRDQTGDPNYIWENAGHVLYRNSKPIDVEIKTKAGEILRLICDPYYQDQRQDDLSDPEGKNDEDSEAMLHYTRAYNIRDLPWSRGGTFTYRLRVAGREDNLALVIDRSAGAKRSTLMGKRSRPAIHTRFPIPIQYHVGKNCVLPNDRCIDDLLEFEKHGTLTPILRHYADMIPEPPQRRPPGRLKASRVNDEPLPLPQQRHTGIPDVVEVEINSDDDGFDSSTWPENDCAPVEPLREELHPQPDGTLSQKISSAQALHARTRAATSSPIGERPARRAKNPQLGAERLLADAEITAMNPPKVESDLKKSPTGKFVPRFRPLSRGITKAQKRRAPYSIVTMADSIETMADSIETMADWVVTMEGIIIKPLHARQKPRCS